MAPDSFAELTEVHFSLIRNNRTDDIENSKILIQLSGFFLWHCEQNDAKE
jgi:hypothetical protein